MKLPIENYLHDIDNFFKDKEPKEIYMIYLMIIASIFAFSYMLFWDSSFDSFEKTKNDVKRVSNQIHADEEYLRRNPKMKITQLENEIKKTNEKMLLMRKNNEYIKHKIESISFLIYDEEAWGRYLDSITTNSQKYNLQIHTLTNKYAKVGSSFGHILDIAVVSEGNFNNTLKFINALEQNDLVVDVHDFNLTMQENLHSELNISVWGIKY